MAEDILPMPGSPGPEGLGDWWVVLEDEDQVTLYRREWAKLCKPSRILCWANLPEKAREIDRLIVYFHANTHSGFVKADRLEHDLQFLAKLESLEVPVRFARTISPDQLPSNLRRLAFSSDGKTKANLPTDRVFPGIEILDASSSELRFETQSFPNLRELTSRLDAKWTLLDTITNYPRLDILEIGPIKNPALIDRLGGLTIDYLNLEGGSLTTLAGIERIAGLRCLKLKNLGKLEDIGALEHCPALERLVIHWCARLTDHAPLARIPNLQSLFLFSNRKLNKAAVAADFATRPSVRFRSW